MSESPPSPDPAGDQKDYERIDASDFKASDAPAATSHAAAEGVPPATEADMGTDSTLGSLKQMALSTKPKQALEEVDDPWDPELGGTARIYRGFQKAAGFDGTPAILDVTIGIFEFVWNFQIEEPGRDDRADAGEGEVADVEQGDPITQMARADE